MQKVFRNSLNGLTAKRGKQLQLSNSLVTQLRMYRRPLNGHGLSCQLFLPQFLDKCWTYNFRPDLRKIHKPRPRNPVGSPLGNGRRFDATDTCCLSGSTKGVNDVICVHADIVGTPNGESQGEPNNGNVRITYMNTLAERIRLLIKEVDNSPTKLAAIAGVAAPSVSDWLNGKTRSLKAKPALLVSEHFKVNQKWLTEGVGPMRDLSPSSNTQTASTQAESAPQLINLSEHPDLVSIPRVRFKLSAGVSGFAVEPEDGNGKPVFFRRDWFEMHNYRPIKLFGVRVSGASMEPSLWDGDLVVINTDDTNPHDGDVFAMNYEGEMVIKRMRRDAGEWFATSDNSDQRRYSPKRCTEDVQIIGRVVYKQSERI